MPPAPLTHTRTPCPTASRARPFFASADIRAGARIRSNINFLMLHPVDCEQIFYKYARTDEAASKRGVVRPGTAWVWVVVAPAVQPIASIS